MTNVPLTDLVEIVQFGKIGDDVGSAVLSAVPLSIAGGPEDLPFGERIDSQLGYALGEFSVDVVFSRFYDKLLSHFFPKDGFSICQPFVVWYTERSDEPYVDIEAMTPISSVELDVITDFAAGTVARSKIWK